MIMDATITQILQPGFNLLADENLIHQIIPTGGFGQFTDQPCGRFLYREVLRTGSHVWNQPQNGMESKPLSGILAWKNGSKNPKVCAL